MYVYERGKRKRILIKKEKVQVMFIHSEGREDSQLAAGVTASVAGSMCG